MRAGKVRYVGCSNYAGWQLMKALGDRRARAATSASSASRSTTRCRRATPSTSSCRSRVDQGVGILVWSPLAGGLLSGKYRRGAAGPEGSRQLTDWNEPPVRDEEQLYDIVDVLVEIAEAHGVSAAQVALAWLLGRPGVDLAGHRRAHRGAARRQPRARPTWSSADDERARLDEVSAPPLLYPYWHQAKTASDRLSAADLTLLGPHVG